MPDWLLVGCDDDDKEHAHSVISRFYCDIVAKLAAMSCAAQCSVPIAKQNFFKFWWDEQCRVLKDESVNKHMVWIFNAVTCNIPAVLLQIRMNNLICSMDRFSTLSQ